MYHVCFNFFNMARWSCRQVYYLQAWNFNFNLEGSACSHFSMWIKLPYLNLAFCHFLRDIIAQLNRVIQCKYITWTSFLS